MQVGNGGMWRPAVSALNHESFHENAVKILTAKLVELECQLHEQTEQNK